MCLKLKIVQVDLAKLYKCECEEIRTDICCGTVCDFIAIRIGNL